MNNLRILKYIPFPVIIKRVFKRFVAFFYQKKVSYLPLNQPNPSKYKSFITKDIVESFDIVEEVVENYKHNRFKIFNDNFIDYTLPLKRYNKAKDETGSINWQLDYISGYCFESKVKSSKQVVKFNADVKVPWELARLQHLPQLAMYAMKHNKPEYYKVAQIQLLDFIYNNPPEYGVNWMNTMEVAIRLCNILVTFDILQNQMEEKVQNAVKNSLENHVLFILNHLEKKEGLAGNHYLFNLIGLMFYGTYSQSEKAKKMLLFAHKELMQAIDKQLFNDGGNFEGSTAYHCHVLEVLVFFVAISQKNNLPINPHILNKIENAIALFKVILKKDKTIPLFGDNDSGRLFKWSLSAMEWNRSYKNYGFLENYIDALTGTPSNTTESKFVDLFINNPLKVDIDAFLFEKKCKNVPVLCFKEQTVIAFDQVDTEKIKPYYFKEFGLVVLKSEEFYLAVSLISNAKMHHSWGHVHNDKLSFELQVNNKNLVVDPGTYCYTSNKKLRNEFRSTFAHHGIRVDNVEQNKSLSDENMFYLDHETVCKLYHLTPDKIIAEVSYYGVRHIRIFEVFREKLVITDQCNKAFSVNINKFNKYAPGYGILIEK